MSRYPGCRATAIGSLLLFVMGGSLGSCSETRNRTEIVVVVDTDFEVPREISKITVEATHPAGEVREATADELYPSDLPVYVGLLHETGPLGPFDVSVTGMKDKAQTITRQARMSFVPEHVVVVRMNLLRSCEGRECGDAETCGEEGCRPLDVSPMELDEWPGYPPRIGSDGDAGCEEMPEQCNGRDDDCDGVIDNGYDLDNNEDHCGECHHACSQANATTECIDGECVVDSCNNDEWGDCNESGDDGCESNLTTEENCGSCGNQCGRDEECDGQRCV